MVHKFTSGDTKIIQTVPLLLGGSFEILNTDAKFCNSPDAGDFACVCSRCSKEITEDQVPVRLWPDEGADPESDWYEYRYCEKCIEQANEITFIDTTNTINENPGPIPYIPDDNAKHEPSDGLPY